MITANILFNLNHFNAGKEIKAYEKDGRQQTYLATLLVNRLSLLDMQWVTTGRKMPRFGLVGLTALIVKLTSPLFRFGITNLTMGRCVECVGTFINRNIQRIEFALDKVFNCTGPIIDSACLVSYIAMIALGHPVVGVLGLMGFALLAIKQKGYMPGTVEKILVPFELTAVLYSAITSPIHIIFKSLNMTIAFFLVANYLSKNEALNQSLPGIIVNGVTRNHKIQSTVEQDWKARIRNEFQLNYSSLHASKLREILPKEDKNKINDLDVKVLYTEIESRAQDLRIDFNQTGWQLVKNAVISDYLVDVRPVNFDYGIDILKTMLAKIAEEKDDEQFAMNVRELATIGESCVEGWLRDIGFMLNPKTKDDFAWVIHHQLADLRSELIKEAIRAEGTDLLKRSFSEVSLDLVGGANNVHLINQIENALWHKWRTYKGEVTNRLEGRGIITKLLQYGSDIQPRPVESRSYLDRLANKVRRFSDIVITQINVTLPLPVPVPLYKFIDLIDRRMKAEYQIDKIVDVLYDAIKPEYMEVRNGGSVALQKFSKIEWQTITTWIASMAERDISVLDSDGYYDPEILGTDDLGNPYLTKEGVKLLLWDLGIIQPAV